MKAKISLHEREIMKSSPLTKWSVRLHNRESSLFYEIEEIDTVDGPMFHFMLMKELGLPCFGGYATDDEEDLFISDIDLERFFAIHYPWADLDDTRAIAWSMDDIRDAIYDEVMK
jgi:hypothetical protein